MTMTEVEPGAQVGSRFECDGHKGTVLFIGEVPPTKGVWLGVEWDDSSRGKHDGVHEGKRYFTTSQPGAGSFIRPKKVTLGVTLLSAIKERYGLIEDQNAGVLTEEMFVVGKNQQTTVEMVGAHSVNLRQSRLNQLQNVVIRNSQVGKVGDPQELKENVPNICDMDLSGNLLASWQEMADISGQLNHLKSLNVSENRLKFPEKTESLIEAFATVEVVYLNRMKYSWEQVVLCCQMMRSLHQLHVCFNQLTNMSSLLSLLPSLHLVNLESNPTIQDWNQILTLGDLPCLQTLIVNDCGLSTIEFPDVPAGETTRLFPRLNTLFIAHNKLDKWHSIDELNKLENLQHLKIQHNPLFQDKSMSEATAWSLMTAKIAGLQTCNRSEISPVERRGSEVDYLKMFGRAWKAAGGHQDPSKNNPSQEFLREHPAFMRLVKIYGPPDDAELKEHSTALKNTLLALTIECPTLPKKAPVKKKLPETMTVQKLKVLLQRLYKVSPYDMHLSYSSKRMGGQEIEFEMDTKEIGYYSIEEGDTIYVKW